MKGTPGVGKTTISKRLVSALDACYVGITELVKTENLVISLDDQRDTLIADIQKVSERLQQTLMNSERTVVIDGHYVVDLVQGSPYLPLQAAYYGILRLQRLGFGEEPLGLV